VHCPSGPAPWSGPRNIQSRPAPVMAAVITAITTPAAMNTPRTAALAVDSSTNSPGDEGRRECEKPADDVDHDPPPCSRHMSAQHHRLRPAGSEQDHRPGHSPGSHRNPGGSAEVRQLARPRPEGPRNCRTGNCCCHPWPGRHARDDAPEGAGLCVPETGAFRAPSGDHRKDEQHSRGASRPGHHARRSCNAETDDFARDDVGDPAPPCRPAAQRSEYSRPEGRREGRCGRRPGLHG
jgi:hypothetical protein